MAAGSPITVQEFSLKGPIRGRIHQKLTQRDTVRGDDICDRVPLFDAVDVVDHGSSLNRVKAVRDGLWHGKV